MKGLECREGSVCGGVRVRCEGSVCGSWEGGVGEGKRGVEGWGMRNDVARGEDEEARGNLTVQRLACANFRPVRKGEEDVGE